MVRPETSQGLSITSIILINENSGCFFNFSTKSDTWDILGRNDRNVAPDRSESATKSTASHGSGTVSYTHLTLPTIYSV